MALQRTITEADMAANPILAELQGSAGDIVSIVSSAPGTGEAAPAEELG